MQAENMRWPTTVGGANRHPAARTGVVRVAGTCGVRRAGYGGFGVDSGWAANIRRFGMVFSQWHLSRPTGKTFVQTPRAAQPRQPQHCQRPGRDLALEHYVRVRPQLVRTGRPADRRRCRVPDRRLLLSAPSWVVGQAIQRTFETPPAIPGRLRL